MSEETQIVKAPSNGGNISLFQSINAFHEACEMMRPLAESDLVPDQFKNKPGNCLIAMELSSRIGASPFAVMQALYVIHGRPTWSAQFLISCINGCGKFTPLRYKEVGDKGTDSYGIIAWATDRTGEVLEGSPVTIGMAKSEQWYSRNGSKWKTMPELMLRYRAATFFSRLYCPELTMGMKTTEEVEDMIDVTPKPAPKKTLFTKEKQQTQAQEQPVSAEVKPEPSDQQEQPNADAPAQAEQPKADDGLDPLRKALADLRVTDITAEDVVAEYEKAGQPLNVAFCAQNAIAVVNWVRGQKAAQAVQGGQA